MRTIFELLLVFCYVGGDSAIKLGTVSYWNNEISFNNGFFNFTDNIAAYDAIPDNSLTIVNINYGILDTKEPHLNEYRTIINNLVKRGVKVLGYVPTGYGNRTEGPMPKSYGSCANIEAQVKLFYEAYPQIAGIFFDEFENPRLIKAEDCKRAASDMEFFRKMVKKYSPTATIGWNPAWFGLDGCYYAAAVENEIVLYESESCKYTEMSCASDVAVHMKIIKSLPKRAKTWHVVSSVATEELMKKTVDNAAGQ